jgi:transposase
MKSRINNNKSIDKYNSLATKITNNTDNYWLPIKENLVATNNVNTHSWFDINENCSKKKNKIINAKSKIPSVKTIIKSEKIKILPNKRQRFILLNWLNAYVKMYNETIKILNGRRITKLPIITSWKTLRTKHLKDAKKRIIKQSNSGNKKFKTQVNSHVLDGAIQDACAKYKSCLTNLKRGNIKYFRLRYLKQTKDSKIMKIEKYFIDKDKNTFCNSVFKEPFILKRKESNIDFKLSEINSDFTIHYNTKTNEFTLLNPIKTIQQRLHKNKDTISLDPGIRTFQTGFSNNKCIKIGTNLSPKIKKYLEKMDRINGSDINIRIKQKIQKKCNKKIQNLMDDLHWKSINYLTNNFGNILIGNLSTKSIVKNNSSNALDKTTKRIGLFMKLHQFKKRLEYKCKERKIGYAEIDEAYTSKTCTKCSNLNNNLGSSKMHNCNKCKIKIDRDFGGARNILINSLAK